MSTVHHKYVHGTGEKVKVENALEDLEIWEDDITKKDLTQSAKCGL
jgi:hypothetical protein